MPLVPEPEGILGGLEAYLDFLGIDSLDELEEEQLQLGFGEERDELAA
jgi:hypothetical protein